MSRLIYAALLNSLSISLFIPSATVCFPFKSKTEFTIKFFLPIVYRCCVMSCPSLTKKLVLRLIALATEELYSLSFVILISSINIVFLSKVTLRSLRPHLHPRCHHNHHSHNRQRRRFLRGFLLVFCILPAHNPALARKYQLQSWLSCLCRSRELFRELRRFLSLQSVCVDRPDLRSRYQRLLKPLRQGC